MKEFETTLRLEQKWKRGPNAVSHSKMHGVVLLAGRGDTREENRRKDLSFVSLANSAV